MDFNKMGGRIQNYIILMEEKMNTDANKTIDFEKKLKEKLGKELKKEIENGNYDEIIDYILSAYSEGLNIFYKEGVKSFFEEFAKTNDKNLHAIIGILDSQRETITNLNKKIKTQEERINKLEQEIEAISKKI
ncbi:hypothetical protein CLOBAR_00910 [Intestinibacter bartlettii DSM 16795]|nr:hypothetical protein CLOBAR_00910 [Intestinibacter bartlettii DSM 16795]